MTTQTVKQPVIVGVACTLAALASDSADADPVTTPNTFTSGSPAVAAEVNANFLAFETAVNDNDARIEALRAENDEFAKTNDDLLQRVQELEAFIVELRAVISLQDDNQGNPAVVFSGVNVHINNGQGATESINGLGNLIVGYDEPTQSTVAVCSDGQFESEADCIANNESFLAIHKSGSHNVIVGQEHNYSRSAALIAGMQNTVNADNSSVTGGQANLASGPRSSISAGQQNTASGVLSSVSGGQVNRASGNASSISGGSANTASGPDSSVSGGGNNTASGNQSSVSGGASNGANGDQSSVSGGFSNGASGRRSSVSGGELNGAIGAESSIGGGSRNRSNADSSSVSGGRRRETNDEFDWVAGSLREDE